MRVKEQRSSFPWVAFVSLSFNVVMDTIHGIPVDRDWIKCRMSTLGTWVSVLEVKQTL